MARSKKATATVGHNSQAPLTDEQKAALVTYYQLKMLETQRKIDALMVDVRAERQALNGQFKRMTADLGFTRKEFESEVLAKLRMSESEFAAAERKRTHLHRLAGLKVGEQLDLEDAIADTADDKASAYQDGYRAGRRADDGIPPKHVAPMFHTDWMAGWHKGQEENILQLKVAEKVIAERAAASPEMTPADPVEADLEDGEDEEVDELEQARRLAESGWTKPTAEEAGFAA